MINITDNVPLNTLTTFGVGGKAKYFAEVNNKLQLKKAVKFAQDSDLKIFVLGSGSDILMSDKGFDGVVIKYIGNDLSFSEKDGYVLVRSGAGLIWDNLVSACVDKGFQGIECMSGIPGTVGAAPIQNIGAYGQELKDVFVELEAFDIKNGMFVKMDKDQCEFGYRESFFKKKENKGRFIITDITLKLAKNKKPAVRYESLKDFIDKSDIDNPNLIQVREAVLALRGQKLENPNIIGNAGSFFKNPIVNKTKAKQLLENYPQMPNYPSDGGKVKLFAGWLIDKAGWKGKNVGNVKVSDKNALVITNPNGKASASEIKEFARAIAKDVKKQFGINLEPEVQYIGFE